MYREIRVRPVVRYVVTDFKSDDENQSSVALGEFDNVKLANHVAELFAEESQRKGDPVAFEPARQLRIDWQRAPGAPRDAIRWDLSEVD